MNAPGDLAADRIAALLRTRSYGRSLSVVERTASTNDDARRAALAGAPRGHVVVADRQDAGRGSHGRTWSSPGGLDLYLSIVDRPPLGIAELPPLTLAVGLGVASAVDELLGAHAPLARVKWPNDVWLGGKKCAGILVEAGSQGDQLQSLVIGVGLNVNRRQFDAELSDSATALRAHTPDGLDVDRAVALVAVLTHVELWVERLVADGAASIATALDQRLAMLGEEVRCAEVEGRLRGVAPSGALRIDTRTGQREVFAGRLERASDRAPAD